MSAAAAKAAKMAKGDKEPYPYEKRVQRLGYGAAGIAFALGLVLLFRVEEGRFLGIEVPVVAMMGALALGALGLVLGVARRQAAIALVGGAIGILAVVPAAVPAAGWIDHALGLAYGAALLLAGELVHMTARYERAHRAVERDNVPEEHINKVTDEALRTLGARATLAILAAAGAVALAFLLAALGPAQWRAATETTAPIGVAVAALALALVASLFILARGARLARASEPTPQENTDVAEI